MQHIPQLSEKFSPKHYDITLAISRQKRVFSGEITLTGEKKTEEKYIALHAKDLIISRATIDGAPVEISYHKNDEVRLEITDPAPKKLTAKILFSGTITDAMHGMYPCYFSNNGEEKELIATQFESHHAREVFPCIDEPAAKATFSLEISTEKNVQVLGNMPAISQRDEGDFLVTTFEKTPRMSTYLLAWVIGELQKKSAKTKNGVEVNIWATHAQPAHSLDFALGIAVRSIEFYDDFFGAKYPLPKSDHVALPDFSSGAMENWGLVTYREVCLLFDETVSSLTEKRRIATVIAHELAHQWFGNLVTMQWWNDLWLNESFATLMEHVCVDALEPSYEVWLEEFETATVFSALRRDAIEGVQPVQIDVAHPDEISALFDPSIVYSKGARMLKMCESFVGREAFRNGLQSYFETFAYTNTKADDLWQKLSESSGKNVAEFMTPWLSRSGYPIVSVHRTSDTTYELSQEQFFIGEHAISEKIWPIPMIFSDETLTLLDTKNQTISSDDIPLLNKHSSGHFLVKYEQSLLKELMRRSETLPTSDALQLINTQLLLARALEVESATLLPFLDDFSHQKNHLIWEDLAAIISRIRFFLEHDESRKSIFRNHIQALIRPHIDTLGCSTKTAESENDRVLRQTILGLAIFAKDESTRITFLGQYKKHATSIQNLDINLRPLILATAIQNAETIDEVMLPLLDTYAKTSSNQLQNEIASAVCSAKNADHITHILTILKDVKKIRPQDTAMWFASLLANAKHSDMAWQWLRNNWEWIRNTFDGDKSYDNFIRYAGAYLSTKKQLVEFREFVALLKDEPALTRTILLAEKTIVSNVELFEKHSAGVTAAIDAISQKV